MKLRFIKPGDIKVPDIRVTRERGCGVCCWHKWETSERSYHCLKGHYPCDSRKCGLDFELGDWRDC